MLTVALGAEADRQRAVVASLPRHFRVVEGGSADVVCVGGHGWEAAAGAAIEAGVRRVLVSPPATGDPEAVRSLAGMDARIVVESPVLDPAWQAAAPAMREALADAALIDLVAAGVPGGLVAQLALVLDLGAGLEPTGRVETAGAYVLSGTAGTSAVTLAGTRGRPQLRLDLRGPETHWTVQFEPAAIAVPTRASCATPDGGRSEPAVFETARRAAWKHIAGDGPVPYALADLADALSLASGGAAGGPPPSGAGRA
jgi:hypothetical protein